MNKSTTLRHFFVDLSLSNNYWWGSLVSIGISWVLYMIMTKAVSCMEWSLDRNSGNTVMVDHPSRTRRGDDAHVVPDEKSNSGTWEVSSDQADIDHIVSLLKENGIEKLHNKDHQGAFVDINAALEIEPRCAIPLKYRGGLKWILCQYEEALKDLNLANEIEPDDVLTLSTRGAVYKDLYDFDNALKDLDRANELDGNNYFIKTQRGVVKRCVRDFEGALLDLSHEANARSPHQVYILMQLGVVKRELGQFREALDCLDKACELDSYDAFIYQQRGVVRRELKDLEGALNDLNMAYEIISDDAYTLRRRGITKRELLDYQGSLEDLNKANIIEPYNNLTLNERGVTKKLLGDFQGALEDLCMANHIKADQSFTLKHRGSTHRELGNLGDALQDLSYANTLVSNDFFTLLEMGMTKNLCHDYEGALIDYNKVLEMEPNDPWILRQRGSLKRILKDYNGALEDFNKSNVIYNDLQPKLFSNTLATIMERCFTKYAMKDVAGALQDARRVRNFWGQNVQSLIGGEKLMQATIQSEGTSEHASSFSERQLDISHYVLWIDYKKLAILKNLGRGSYGYVQKCKWVDKNRDVAVKFVSSNIQDAFEKEVEMLARIQHPRVVRLIGCSYDKKEKLGLLVMELMECNLRTLIDAKKRENCSPFDLPVAVQIMVQIAEAMEYLHEQGVLHRDLKSSNILVNSLKKNKDDIEQYVVKIADFGMAKLQGQNNMPYFMTLDVGATLWRAPEVFKIGPYQKYSFPADVWSYGITCFEILSGEVPFEGVPCVHIRSKILSGLRPVLPESCPAVLKLLLKKCWDFSPCDRPTFLEIRKILKLYLTTIVSRDVCEFRPGDVIRPYEIRRHSSLSA